MDLDNLKTAVTEKIQESQPETLTADAGGSKQVSEINAEVSNETESKAKTAKPKKPVAAATTTLDGAQPKKKVAVKKPKEAPAATNATTDDAQIEGTGEAKKPKKVAVSTTGKKTTAVKKTATKKPAQEPSTKDAAGLANHQADKAEPLLEGSTAKVQPAKTKKAAVNVSIKPLTGSTTADPATAATPVTAPNRRSHRSSNWFSQIITTAILSRTGNDAEPDHDNDNDFDDENDDGQYHDGSDIDDHDGNYGDNNSVQNDHSGHNHNSSGDNQHDHGDPEKAIFISSARELASAGNNQQKPLSSNESSSKEPAAKRGMNKSLSDGNNTEKLATNSSNTGKTGTKRTLLSNIDISGIIFKTLNLLFPLFFVVLIALHIYKQGRSQFDGFALSIEAANKIAVTLWPIMFAAVATQSLRAYATFQAERGINLMALEQLLHSTSFSSSIKQPLMLRKIDVISILLFVLWGVSPLASQALQRVSTLEPDYTYVPTNISYYQSHDYEAMVGGSDFMQVPSANAVFVASLISPKSVLVSAVDSWGNPKMPMLDGASWSRSNAGSGNTTWSASVGIPLGGIGYDRKLDATIFHNYLEFTCTPPKISYPSDFNSSLAFNWTADWYKDGAVYVVNDEQFSYESSLRWPGTTTGNIYWAFRNAGFDTDLWNQAPDKNDQYVVSNCSWQSVALTAGIECDGTGNASLCSVNQVDKSNGTAAKVRMDNLLLYTLNAMPTSGFNGYSPLAEYFMNPPAFLNNPYDGSFGGLSSNMSVISSTDFETRLANLLNTYWLAIAASTAIVAGPTSGNLSFGIFSMGSSTSTNLVYGIDIAWVVLFFVCDAIILFFALADIFLEAYTISPNFLGFASSVVRSNQHLRKEFVGKVDGHERARAMAGMKVMIQDVNAVGERGKIALAPSAGATRLRRGRQYV